MCTKINKIALLGVLIAQAVILGYIEMLLNLPIVLPGIKIGLANISSILAVVLLGLSEALLISIIKSIILSLIGGGMMSFLFSAFGGVLSVLVMYLLYKMYGELISIWSISIAGAVTHNITQLTVASLLIKDASVYFYLPVLIVSATATGALTGVVSQAVIKSLKTI